MERAGPVDYKEPERQPAPGGYPRFYEGQRIRVRGRVWEIESPILEAENAQILSLRDVHSPTGTLKVISTVEEIEPLPPANLPKTLGDYGRWRDLHRAILCTMQPPPGMLGGFDQARMATEDYQLVPVIRAFERPLQRLLIADDVGLGKTAEAIHILLELQARARAQRVLVVCPAGLVDQWTDELREKAGLSFDVFADSTCLREAQREIQISRNPWAVRRHIVTSIDYAKRYDVRRMLRDLRWDLVIVDEAHYLGQTSSSGKVYHTERSRFGTFIAERTDSLVLLTATPHTGDRQSLFSLINLVDPTLLASPDELMSERVASVLIRRYKSDIHNEQGERRFKDIHTRTMQVPFSDERERELYDRVVRYCNKRWKNERNTAVGFAMTVIKKRLISSRYALSRTLQERLNTLSDEPINVDLKRGLLADLRAGVPLTEEQQAEAERRVLAAPPGDVEDRTKECRELERLIAYAQAIPSEIDSKAQILLHELEAFHSGKTTEESEKVILFTEYRDTHNFLMGFLRDNGYTHPIATLTGAMTREQRTAQLNIFAKAETMLLLATDAASEGLNLQEYCRVIVHYELPWNPNRLEQRNGRVYRWGQQRDVIACNLAYADTYDAHVLKILMEKSQRIRADLGSASDVIGVMESISWEDLLMTNPRAKASDPADIERARARIDREVSEARRRLVAWRDAELGQSQRFDCDERNEVEYARRHNADQRLTAEERQRIVEWIVPLCGGRVTRNPIGTVTIDVPQTLRRYVPARIETASYAYDESLREFDVEVLGMHHPLLAACGITARAAIYDGTSSLVTQRVAGKVADTANAGVLYTFIARYASGDGSTFAEEFVPVFSPMGLPCSEDPIEDQALFTVSPLPGSLNHNSLIIQRLLQIVDNNRRDAEIEATRRTRIRSCSFEAKECQRADVMLHELEHWIVGKRAWLEHQLRLPVTQMMLEFDEDQVREQRREREVYERQRRRLQQEWDTLDAHAAQRREDIAKRGEVIPPAHLEFIGALLIVPTYEVAP